MSTENLYNKEAKKKLTDIVEDITVTMFATNLGSQPLSVIPMYTKKVDDTGNIWFLSGKDSDHNRDINKDKKVQLMYSDPSDMKFISIYGTAEIVTDKSILEELYSKMDNAWFDGENDPNLSAIKVTPSEAAYWENDSNKLVTLFKLASSAITGNDQEIGTSGKIKM